MCCAWIAGSANCRGGRGIDGGFQMNFSLSIRGRDIVDPDPDFEESNRKGY